MDTLVITSKTGKDVTTSLIVANIFGKDHKHVLRDIQQLECSYDFRQSNFGLSNYISMQGKELPMFELTKDGFSFLAMGYTGTKAAQFKERFINEFNKREQMLRDDDYILARSQQILSRRLLALEHQVKIKEEQLMLQETVIVENAPKVQYYQNVLQSTQLINTNVIAKELGMSAITLNKMLHEAKIIYKSGNTWVLYQKYQNKGYTGTKTSYYTGSTGELKTIVHTYWTEKGRLFIHNYINNSH